MNAAAARSRIAAEDRFHAFISLTQETGEGTVVGVKDLVDVRGTVTTAGSVLVGDAPSEGDARVVELMRAAGCVVVGKTNLHEFAFGVTSENPHFGAVLNPRDLTRVAGGSSGGSAAAVAAGLVEWALGSDTGGSIRIPAGWCGVVGLKPTIGSVDVDGVFPLSPSLDTLGPIAPDVRGAGAAFEQMTGLARLVPATVPDLAGLRLGVPAGWVGGLDPEVERAWTRVSAGLPEVAFPAREELAAAGLTILQVEAASIHRRRVVERPDGFGEDVLGLLREALRVPREDYVAALLAQSRLRAEVAAALDAAGLDALLVPASRVMPPRVGEPHRRGDVTAFTRPFNTTGQPVLTIPAPAAGLPVGIQVVGRHGREADLLAVGMALEAAWAGERP